MTQPTLYIVYKCTHEFPDTNALMEQREMRGPEKKISLLNKKRRAISLDEKLEPIRRPCMDLCPRCKAKEHVSGKQKQMAQSDQVPRSLPQPPAITQPKQSTAPHSLEDSILSMTDASKSQPRRLMIQTTRETPTTAKESRLPSPGLTETWDVFDVPALSKKRDVPGSQRRQLRRAPAFKLGQGIQRRNTAEPSQSSSPPEESRLQISERVDQWTQKKVAEAIKKQTERERNRQAPQISDQPIPTSNSSHHIESNNDELMPFPRSSPTGRILKAKESPPDPLLIPEALRFRKPKKKKGEERRKD
ncbi:hypothetical protein EYC80_007957 [Monilinia laxa]|uniref:Uncharacterized protein n=1 Tax=Monilinia laxa TaxID=61186 RepID=A0A5N6JTR9_MONLA|nr:hypothetical protein EYC80_007957 [Monilinia laxa]